MGVTIRCVLMRAGTSRGPFFLREWLPADDAARDETLIGAIGASDPLQLDGVGGGSTLNSKVAIVSRSTRPGCDLDYLFAQVGVGHRSVDTRPNCGNMLSGVVPFALEQGLIAGCEGTTRARVHNVNTGSRIDVTVRTPGGRVSYEGDARIDGVAGTAAPILLDFVDAWGAVTGKVFPTGQRIDTIDGIEVTCIDAAMPLMIIRAADLGVTGREKPATLDADPILLARIEALRLEAGRMMGLGDVADSVIPKPVLVSPGDSPDSIVSRYFTPRRCHASHAVTGAIGVATAFALPATVASGAPRAPGNHALVIQHPAGRIDVAVEVEGEGDRASITSAALVRTARKIFQGELHLPDYVFSDARRDQPMTVIVPTRAGGGNDTMARILAARLAPILGREIRVDNRPGANGAIACEFVARAAPDGAVLLLGYVGTHAMSPALQPLGYDPVGDFEPVGMVGWSPTLLVAHPQAAAAGLDGLLERIRARPGHYAYASAGDGTAPHFAAELFQIGTGTRLVNRSHDGAAPALADVVDGKSQLMFPSLFAALPQVRRGELRALAVAGDRRVAALPELPTLAEAGVSDVEVRQWYGLFAPAATDKAVVDRLNSALNQVLADPAVARDFQRQGAEVDPGAPSRLRERVVADLAQWRDVVERRGIVPQDARLAAEQDI